MNGRLEALFEYAKILNSFNQTDARLFREITEVVNEIRKELGIDSEKAKTKL